MVSNTAKTAIILVSAVIGMIALFGLLVYFLVRIRNQECELEMDERRKEREEGEQADAERRSVAVITTRNAIRQLDLEMQRLPAAPIRVAIIVTRPSSSEVTSPRI